MNSLNKVQQLFDLALERSPDERYAFLKDACAGDEALLREVLSLLAADSGEDSLLDQPGAQVLDLNEEVLAADSEVGSYRILEEIGSGGMGTVYLAERADENFEQRVALKIIKPGMLSTQVLQRFHSERQILARLHHNNIARLLDGGVSTNGLPFFTMEFIQGEPIDEYCDRQKLKIRDRLRLFQTVCAAVSYAHRNLVVHRDLKSANILVQEDGTVKLLDFGIAKLLDPTVAGASHSVTMTAQRMLTPDYASPEQIRGEPIGIASDVYQLGVILFVLLTGQRPHNFTTTSFAEMERIICDLGIEKLSTAVLRPWQTGDTDEPEVLPETNSRARGCEPQQLRRLLRGDLDNIALMALRKEPERRYLSVEHFSLDIEHYLTGRPVMARPATLTYRAQKFAQRNRGRLTSTALVLALLLFVFLQVVEQRDLAQLEAKKAKQVSEFVVNLFKVSDPNQSLGKEITARELLDSGLERIDQDLNEQPEVQATMLNVLGRVYHSLGFFDQAIGLQERVLGIQRTAHGEKSVEVAEGSYELGRSLMFKLENERAEEYFLKSLTFYREHDGNHNEQIAAVLDKLGGIDRLEGRHGEGIAKLNEALAIRGNLFDKPNLQIANSEQHLAKTLVDKGDFELAEPLFLSALAQYEAIHPANHPQIGSCLNNLALLYERRGDYNMSVKMLEQAISIWRETLDEGHPDLATSLQNLAYSLTCLAQYEKAQRLYEEAISMRRKLFGDEHSLVALSLNNLGRLLIDKGDYSNAEAVLNKSLDIREKIYDEGDWRIGYCKRDLAKLALSVGHYGKAEKLIREALATFERRFGAEGLSSLRAMTILASALHGQGKNDVAEKLLRQTLAVQRDRLPETHPALATTLTGLGSLLASDNRSKEAESFLREALAIRSEKLPEGHFSIGETASALGFCMTNLGEFAEADSLLGVSAQNLNSSKGDQDYLTRLVFKRIQLLKRTRAQDALSLEQRF